MISLTVNSFGSCSSSSSLSSSTASSLALGTAVDTSVDGLVGPLPMQPKGNKSKLLRWKGANARL